MAIQHAVQELAKLGPLPSEDDEAWDNDPNLWEMWLGQIQKPVSDDDAVHLCGLFGNDMGFGLGWTILHAVESAPSWPITEAVLKAAPFWKQTIITSCRNAGIKIDTT